MRISRWAAIVASLAAAQQATAQSAQPVQIVVQAYQRCMAAYAVTLTHTAATDDDIYTEASRSCLPLKNRMTDAISAQLPPAHAAAVLRAAEANAKPDFIAMIARFRNDEKAAADGSSRAPSDGDDARIRFPSAEVAFDRGIEACEALYAGTGRSEPGDPTKPGPFSSRGFYMSGIGDEAKVDLLMAGPIAHVYKGNISEAKGVVYVVFTRSPLACRVGSFDADNSHEKALERLTNASSGWAPQPTASPVASTRMQLFEKKLDRTTATLNLSWPAASRTGPQGLTAMATMIIRGEGSPRRRNNPAATKPTRNIASGVGRPPPRQ